VLAAGRVAQLKKSGCADPNDGETDRRYLRATVQLAASSPDLVEPLICGVETRAEALVAKHWSAIERLANALLSGRGELNEQQILSLVNLPTRGELTERQIRRLALPLMARAGSLRAESFDGDSNSVDVIWTTGAAVRRNSWTEGPYDEILETGANNVRLGRLNNGAPLLASHSATDLHDVIGVVAKGSARMENGLGLASVQLSRAPEHAGIVQNVRDGILRNISCGYRCHRIEKENGGEVPTWRVSDWEVLELSLVAIGADPGAQIRSDKYVCEVSELL
jgi:HK97 family phage prohead protease